jgi:two-component system, chemotaxis family, CheB/CheR fusion protein
MVKTKVAPAMLVGIGASAGGLEALKALLPALPNDSGLAFVVVVHLSADQPSVLAEILAPFSPMPVTQVAEDQTIEPNRIYVIPPGRNLSDVDGQLRLSTIDKGVESRSAIDHFFETLANAHEERSIGIVLSGTGADGSLGVGRIKQQGGLTIAQDPTEAQFDAMPRNAIATGHIDFVLPVREMPRRMLRFAATQPQIDIAEPFDVEPPPDKSPSRDQEALASILSQVRARTNTDFSKYKHSTVLRRIRRRMQLHQKERLPEYLDFLRANPNEANALADEFLITITQFFRDADVFAHLEREVVPKLFEGKKASDNIRVWSVGCASGEEAYSIAMLLIEQAGRMAEAPHMEVFASDIHEPSLRRAREGAYPDTIEGEVSSERLRRFFTKEDNGYRIRRELREIVVFANHNLLRDPPFSRIDLIVCRNLLIYLQRDLQSDVIDIFHYASNPGGMLLLGPSESIDRAALFQPESKQFCLYRRRNVPVPEPRLNVFPQTFRRVAPFFDAAGARLQPAASYGVLHQKMVERYALPSLLVDQDYRVVHASEHAGRYLQVPGGELSASVFRLAREELRIELRAALHAAMEHGESSRSRPVPMALDGETKQVVLHVRPSRDPELGNLQLVIFDEYDMSETAPPVPTGSESAGAQVELEAIRERLRAVVEQYETSQEEMRAANEELQSVNEELRSTMEELETSKEELQSMNEELQTVNQENRHKVLELSQLTGDLQNLMAATEIATLFLDRDLRILRVTPRTRELFNIRASDRGRPFMELRHRLGDDQLEQDALNVLERLTPVEREIKSETGQWYLTRVNPYRSSADKIEGVVITLVDITRIKTAELAIRDSEENFRALVTASAQTVWTANAQGTIVQDSPSWRAFTGQTLEQFLGEGWADAVHPDDRENVLRVWRDCVATHAPFNIELRVRHASGDWRWMHARAVPLRHESGEIRGWIGMNADITARRETKEALREADRRKDEFLAMLSHELRNPLAPLRNAMTIFDKALPADSPLRRIRDVSERQLSLLTHIVDQLLDVARIGSGRLELTIRRFDFRKVVDEVVSDFDFAAKERRHKVVVEQSSEALEIAGDELRLDQIVTNLLDNAIKFTPEGGCIRVSLCREGVEAVLSVADNGEGLTPELRARIFDVFNQGDVSFQNRKGGLGLGLTIVRRIAELHGGSVSAHSEGPGKGSTFVLRLPLATRKIEADQGQDDKAPALPAPAPRRILLVEDNVDAAESLTVLLGIEGHRVLVAHDGSGALKIAEAQAPEIVVLDIGLPDMDGYELARRLRDSKPTSKALLIAVTGFGQAADRARSTEAGIDHHFIKPVDLKALQDVIRTHFQQG